MVRLHELLFSEWVWLKLENHINQLGEGSTYGRIGCRKEDYEAV
jgi:hypothetical protein